jgi:outer membrane protein assembly factor BamB
MTCFRGFVLAVLVVGCQTQPPPAPEPPAARKEAAPRLTDIGATTLALPSSSLVAVTGKGVTAFSPSGVLAWTFKLPANDSLTAKPVAAPNSFLYLRGARTVYAVGPDGRQAWAADVETALGAFPSLVVLTDSSVVALSGDMSVTCLTTTGTVRWTYKLPDGSKVTGEPTSAPNGFLLLRAKERIYALNSEGQLQWSAVVPPPT